MTSTTPSTDSPSPSTPSPSPAASPAGGVGTVTTARTGIRWFYGLAAVAGTVIPWIFFGSFLSVEGADLVGFVEALFDNGAAGGFSADLLITATVFWLWSYQDSRTTGVERWWLVVPATLFVGLSLAFPLYLFWREGAASRSASVAA